MDCKGNEKYEYAVKNMRKITIFDSKIEDRRHLNNKK